MDWLTAIALAAQVTFQTCDMATTHMLLNRPGFSEGNPVLGNSLPRIYTIKVSLNVGSEFLRRKTKRKKASLIMPISMAAAGAVGCVVNTRHLKE